MEYALMGQQGGIRAATGAVNFAAMAYFLKFYHLKIFNSLQMMVEIIVRVQTLGRNKIFFSVVKRFGKNLVLIYQMQAG
jgi:hypothetical protein